MRTNPDSQNDDALLDALLCDESWQSADAAFKQRALQAFRVRQRTRRVTRWAGGVAILAVAMFVTVHWLHAPVTAPRKVIFASSLIAKPLSGPRHLTDEELVASFPRGSCFIAEVDGKKQLVFVDPKMEQTYLAR
jgi:hypothetical protein